jgi:hypothetical protein
VTVSIALDLRVSVPEVWDTVHLAAAGDWTIERVKQEALAAALSGSASPDRYVVKYRGALMLDEGATLSALGVPAGAALVVIRAHRRPVR